jgi:hypothetical protein
MTASISRLGPHDRRACRTIACRLPACQSNIVVITVGRIMLKHIFLIAAGVLLTSGIVQAADKSDAPKYEYALIKWDGPDRIYYNLPDKFELVHLRTQGVTVPKEAQDEEFCLAYAANQLAKDGWEAVNLDSRRILMRRAKK